MQYFQNFPKSLETIMYSRMTSCKGLSRTLVQVASTSYNLIILFVTFFFCHSLLRLVYELHSTAL